MIEWVHVKSSAIRSIGYEVVTMRMYIDFENSEPIYTFCRVPERVYTEFTKAHSVGQYYHQHIKGRYDC